MLQIAAASSYNNKNEEISKLDFQMQDHKCFTPSVSYIMYSAFNLSIFLINQ